MTRTDRFLAKETGFVPDQRVHYGLQTTRVSVGQDYYRFTGLNSDQAGAIAGRFPTQIVAHCRDGVEIELFRAPELLFQQLRAPGWEYRLNFAYSEHRVWLEGPGFVAQLERSPRIKAELWTCVAGGGEFDGIFENVLRVVTAYRLLDRRALLLHSSAIQSGRQACVFVGRSGAGKTTIARMALQQGFEVPSDDLNAVVPGAGSPLLHPVPYSGDLQSRDSKSSAAMLSAVYLLQKGPAQQVSPVSGAMTASRLLSCCPFVNQDPFCVDQLLDVINDLIRSCPVSLLEFARENVSWDGLWQAA